MEAGYDHLVVGAGEVGQAVHANLSLVRDCAIRDVKSIGAVQATTLDVCFPWSETFVADVQGYVAEHLPTHVVVHSTVPVGTCDPYGWTSSPVRGRHPRLREALRTFPKFVCGRDSDETRIPWDELVETVASPRARDAEAMKLWELTQFGIQVLVEKEIHRYCEENDVDFGLAYRLAAVTYNEGYTDMGDYGVVRPVLEHVPGPIGGHCVAQNSGLLDHKLGQWVAEEGPKW